jgi:N-acetylglucosamine-6-phosphate deacetylase
VILEGQWVFSQQAKTTRIEIDAGTIVRVEEIEKSQSDGAGNANGAISFLSPGFFDAQVNGYRGSDYSLPDMDAEHVQNIVIDMAKSGATRHIATIVTSPQERILRNLELLEKTIHSDAELTGAIPGVHLEGPYISEEDGPRGAHDRAFARDPDVKELDEWIAASDRRLRVVTLAPERKGSIEYIEALVERGVVPAIGHTGATPDEIERAVDAGARLSTHLGNGSHAMLPRLKNYLWQQLSDDRLAMGLISDGFHIPAPVMKCMVRAKGLERTMIVSDVALHGGAEAGRYTWGNIEVEVFPDGHLGVADTPYLAGAGHMLSWAIPRFIEATNISVCDAIRLCTSNPARILGLAWKETLPVVGGSADLVQFIHAPDIESLQIEALVRNTFVL